VLLLAAEQVRTVAPHAGAWIETNDTLTTVAHAESRLMQARGLKLFIRKYKRIGNWSRLMQARGLKLSSLV